MNRNFSLLLMLAGCCFGAQQQDSATLAVRVRPEVLLTAGSGAVNLKIRLSEGASAQLWTADSCAAPPIVTSTYDVSNSGQFSSPPDVAVSLFSISKSGTYQIQLSSPGDKVVTKPTGLSLSNGYGKNVCLQSSDGLRAQVSTN